MGFVLHLAAIFPIFLLLLLSRDAHVNLQVCICFVMSTYKEYIGRVVCLTLAAFGVCICLVCSHPFVALFFSSLIFNEVVSATTPAYLTWLLFYPFSRSREYAIVVDFFAFCPFLLSRLSRDFVCVSVCVRTRLSVAA